MVVLPAWYRRRHDVTWAVVESHARGLPLTHNHESAEAISAVITGLTTRRRILDFGFTLLLWWQDDTAEALAELHDRDLLLAYQFPSKAAGPMGGGQEVHVFHKCALRAHTGLSGMQGVCITHICASCSSVSPD